MDIKIDLKIFLFALLFIFTGQIELYILFMVFTLLHEIGHLLMGILLGFKIKQINIMPVGFSIAFETNIVDYNKKIKKANYFIIKKLIIAISGPLINVIVCIICLLCNKLFTQRYAEIIIYTNILIALFNLIPIYPLDGGRIVKYILQLFYSKRRVYNYTHLITKITICILTIMCSIWILYIHNIAFFITLAYLWYLVRKEEKYYKNKMQLYEAYEKMEKI